jgi:hypothetical protein
VGDILAALCRRRQCPRGGAPRRAPRARSVVGA